MKDKENPGSIDTGEQSRAKLKAIKILGSRMLSSNEMEKRLTRKGESEESARDTVKWLEDIGAVNDAEYASSIVSHYIAKGYGSARVRDELFKRGIPRELWDDAIASLEEDEANEAALCYIEKKLKGSRSKDDLRRVTEALCRRGFSYEEARRTVSRYLEAAQDNVENGENEDEDY